MGLAQRGAESGDGARGCGALIRAYPRVPPGASRLGEKAVGHNQVRRAGLAPHYLHGGSPTAAPATTHTPARSSGADWNLRLRRALTWPMAGQRWRASSCSTPRVSKAAPRALPLPLRQRLAPPMPTLAPGGPRGAADLGRSP